MACRCHTLAFNRLQIDIRQAIQTGQADLAYRMTRSLTKLARLIGIL